MAFKPSKGDFKSFEVTQLMPSEEFGLQEEEISTPSRMDYLKERESALGSLLDIPRERLGFPVKEALLGGAQGLIGGATSLANLPLEAISKIIGKDISLPYQDFSESAGQDPLSQAAFTGGKIAGSLVPGFGAFKGAQALTEAPLIASALKKAMVPSMGRQIGAGALAGFGVGGGQDLEDQRGMSAAIGGALSGAGALLPGQLIKGLGRARSSIEKQFQKAYTTLFKDIKTSKLDKPELRIPSILRNVSEKSKLENISRGDLPLKRKLNEFTKSPTFKDAHEAQSELGRFIRKTETKIRKTPTGVPMEKHEALKDAEILRKKIRGSMQQFLLDKGKPEFLARYSDLTKSYPREVIPLKHPAIVDPSLRPREALTKILKDRGGIMAKGGPYTQIPGLGSRRLAEELKKSTLTADLMKTGAMAAGLGSVPYAYKFLK